MSTVFCSNYAISWPNETPKNSGMLSNGIFWFIVGKNPVNISFRTTIISVMFKLVFFKMSPLKLMTLAPMIVKFSSLF